MRVKALFKDYGKGKKRIILINEEDSNRAFASFSENTNEYKYLKGHLDGK